MPGFASAVLAPAGIHSLYGDPSAGLPVIAAPDGISGVLARAHQAVRNVPAGAVSAGGVDIPGRLGGDPVRIEVSESSVPAELVVSLRSAIRAGGARVEFAIDPDRPWPASATVTASDVWPSELTEPAQRLDRADRVVILAGPGVVHDGQVPGLHALSAVLGCGVLNTWGAKGIFHWRSQHHWATIGLQERDFELAGLDEADLLVVVGLDEREAPASAWSPHPHLVIDPIQLDRLAEVVPARPVSAPMPPIRALLTRATQSGRGSRHVPIPPSLATLHYGRNLSRGGFIAADAGQAGFWVARTFGTTDLGTVAVPPYTDPGWATACVTVARLANPLRPALAVVDALDEMSAQVVDFARSCGVGMGIEVWDASGEALSADGHQARLAELVDPLTAGRVDTLATDPGQLDAFLEAAGPVRSWSPPAPAA